MFENLVNQYLPKWPQLMIVGEPVSIDQAKDIIFRTDYSLYNPLNRGNNKKFEEWYYEISGLGELWNHCRMDDESPDTFKWFTILNTITDELRHIELDFVTSSVAYSAFIGGPVGFCSPNGRIFFQDNIGKWPSVEEVYDEFVLLAREFPYLRFTASLYNGESCEYNNEVVVSFIINNGDVIITDQDFDLLNHKTHPPKMDDLIQNTHHSRELGLPLKWYEEQADRIKSIISRHLT